MWSCLLIIACLFALSSAFQYGGLRKYQYLHKVRQISLQASIPAVATHSDGQIPTEVAKVQAINDMILVERLSAPTVTASGLFLPKIEGRDLKPLGRVLSIPSPTSMVIEHGSGKASKVDVPFKVGDVVAIRVSRMYFMRMMLATTMLACNYFS